MKNENRFELSGEGNNRIVTATTVKSDPETLFDTDLIDKLHLDVMGDDDDRALLALARLFHDAEGQPLPHTTTFKIAQLQEYRNEMEDRIIRKAGRHSGGSL